MSDKPNKPRDVVDIVESWLRASEYDGLYSDDGECACEIGDIAPCGAIGGTCRPGYKVQPPAGSPYNFLICETKDQQGNGTDEA